MLDKQVAMPSLARGVATNPVHRCLERERALCNKLLTMLRSDITNIIAVCSGTQKGTNRLRELIAALRTDSTPALWSKFYPMARVGASSWIRDFCRRVDHLNDLLSEPFAGLRTFKVELCNLFFPTAFITATRQYVAETLSVSLDDLTLKLDASSGAAPTSDSSFSVKGLVVEGGEWSKSNVVSLSSSPSTEMPVCVFEWASSTADSKDVADTAVFPVYLNSNRSEFMFSVELDVDPAVKSESYALRSIALVASSLKDAMAL